VSLSASWQQDSRNMILNLLYSNKISLNCIRGKHRQLCYHTAFTFWCQKGKVIPVLLTEHHAMKTYTGSGGMAPRILDLGTRWSEWSASRPSRFTPREREAGTHWIEGWVSPRAVLDKMEKRIYGDNFRSHKITNISGVQHVMKHEGEDISTCKVLIFNLHLIKCLNHFYWYSSSLLVETSKPI
jgi:hypothetical protein